MSVKGSLEDIFNDDEFGLLKVKPAAYVRNADERLLATFEEINAFYERAGREPQSGNGVQEHQLSARLKGLIADPEKVEMLLAYDKFNLLRAVTPIESISDIFEDDSLGLLENDADHIFDLKHVPKETNMPDYIASRKPCVDFAGFEQLFKNCHQDLQSNKRKLYPFKNEQQIGKGYFFVLKGIMLYIADVSEKERIGGKTNARLRCIFENGTESDMLLRSLAAELYKNGRRITEQEEKLLDNFTGITEEDEEAGFIYVLKSKSDRLDITSIKNLYKIGYSRGAVEERIKNAAQDATYLMAPVSIVTAFRCYNMNPQKLEQLLHNFFGTSCLNVDVFDAKGKRTVPREWFIAPLVVIEQAIEMIVSGKILNYRYDSTTEQIEATEVFDKARRTLSIRQPYAEQIMLGIKVEEYRSIPTNIRGRIYIYASNTLDEVSGKTNGIKNTDLARGVIIGSVEVTGCYGSKSEGYSWTLANPERLLKPIKPAKQPQPVWFYPF